MKYLHLSFVLLLSFFLTCPLTYGQDDSLRKVTQVNVYEPGEAFQAPGSVTFPPRRSDNWAVGIQGSTPFIQGEIRPELGYGLGLTVRKSLGHTFSLRYQGLAGIARGLDWRPAEVNNAPFYRNHRTLYSDHSIQLVASSNNIHFAKSQVKMLLYGFVGGGAIVYQVQQDLLNEGGDVYDYTSFDAPTTSDDRGATLDALRDLLDRDYETNFADDPLDGSLFDSASISPTVVIGGGVSFRLSRRIDLNLEYRVSWHNTYFLDGESFSLNNLATTTNDILHHPSVGLSFKIGKGEESRWWQNPLKQPYQEIQQMRARVNKVSKDTDGDGVLDIVDQDNETPRGQKVTTLGVADTSEARLLTLITGEVSKLNERITNLSDQTDRNLEAIRYELPSTLPISTFPLSVYFDYNSAKLKRTFYPELLKVANYLAENPDQSVEVSGHTDVRGTEPYNTRLAERRADATIAALVRYFDVDQSQLQKRVAGESEPLLPLVNKKPYPTEDAAHYLNRRVTFTLIP
ncbi:MAG: OmpA family protein [Bacteroidota bacterium]